jgi:signal transduction histidine kinase
VWKLNDSSWEELAAPPRELGPQELLRRTQAIARDAKGDLWLSVVRVGLFRLRDGQWELVRVPGFPAREFPIAIYPDTDGSIWLGYSRGRLASLTHDTWRLYTDRDGLKIGTVQALARIRGELWLGGERALQRIHNGRFESVPGLTELGSVKGILQAKNGDLWLSTSTGGVHVTGPELRHLDAPLGAALAYEKLTALDGMPGVAAAIRPLPNVLETDDGRIWFEADDRFSSFDPDEHSMNTAAAHVMIGAVTDDGRRREPAGALTLFPNVRNVAIDYTATRVSIPSRVRFKYRLENFDQVWQDVGTRRVAYYNNLPPGRYVFHVIAANDDGIWNAQGATISLIVPPLFYQTLLFRLAVLALGILLFAALFLIQLRRVTDRQRKRLEERMEDRLNERTRIARELHDSLLQGFHGFMFLLEAVRKSLPEHSDAADRLNSAMQLGDQAINEGREAVQNLRSTLFDECDLATSLRALGVELGIGIPLQSRPQYLVVVDGKPRELVAAVRADVYRIAREAVRNAYQHAIARHVKTEITFGETELSIRVRDDGIGVEPTILARGQRAGHWGLPGMRERSASFGGRLSIWSNENAGTEVELRIAAEIAYVQPKTSTRLRMRRVLIPFLRS